MFAGIFAAGLLAVALLVAFILQNANPSVQGQEAVYAASGPLGSVQQEGSSLRVFYKWGRTSNRIQSRDPALLKTLQAAVDTGEQVTLRVHLEGAHFDADTGLPVFWVESVVCGDKEYGPFEPRVPWSWRVLRDEQVALLRGIVLHSERQFNAALTEFNRSLDKPVLSRNQRGLAYALRASLFEFKAYGEPAGPGRDFFFLRAAEDYAEGAKLRPDDAGILRLRAGSLIQLGGYPEALAAYDQAAKLAPGEYLESGIPRTSLLRKQGRYPESLQVLDEIAAREKSKQGMMFHYHRGWTLLLMQRHEDAAAAFTEGLESQKDWPWAHMGRACARHALADIEGALADLHSTEGIFKQKKSHGRGETPDDDAVLLAELLNNVRGLERERAQGARARLTICERFHPDFEEPLRTRSKLLDAS